MSKKNTSVNDILEEFSPDGHKVDVLDTNTTEPTTDSIPDTPKTLEQLEMESLQAISQGKLSDSAINYSSYTNKPNKIIENPKQNTEYNGYYSKGVVKINSRPDFKDKSNIEKKKVSDNHKFDDTSNATKKIDSRNSKAKLESANTKRNYARSHNEISEQDFNNMSEKLKKAKAKKQLQIDELNAKYKLQAEQSSNEKTDDTPIETINNVEDKSSNIDKPSKKSFIQKIVDYYTIPADDELSTEEDSKEVQSLEETISEDFSSESVEQSSSNPKKKESFKEFVTDLFISKEKKPPMKKESFKERIVDFFTVQDDEEDFSIEKNPNIEISVNNKSTEHMLSNITTEVKNESASNVENEVNSLLNSLVENLSVDDTNSVESIPLPVEEESVPLPVEEESIPLSVEEESTPLPVEEESTPLSVEEESIPLPVEEESTPLPVEEESIPLPVEEESIPLPVEEESIPLPVEEESIPLPVEEESTPLSVEEESIPLLVEEKSTPLSVEEESLESSIETEDNPIQVKVEKKPNIFKRIKMFFLMEELQAEESNEFDELEEESPVFNKVEESPVFNKVEESPVFNKVEESSVFNKVEESPVVDKFEESPVVDKFEESPVVNKFEESPVVDKFEESPVVDKFEESPVFNKFEESPVVDKFEESPVVDKFEESPVFNKVEESPVVDKFEESPISDDDYIMPLDEDAPSDSIDIPIDEPIKYKHFWQDPDFNPIDRIQSYWKDTAEKYKNRKRSGEIHIEIKSNPETAILISDLKAKVLAEERLQKSREEYKKQVLNGEYDDFEETSKKVTDDEPVFTDAPSNDFTSYEDTSRIQSYITDMKNSLIVRITITAILCVLSILLTIPNDLELPTIEMFDTSISASGYLMVQSALGFIAIITSIKGVISGIGKIFKRKADSDSFASIGIVLAFVCSVMTLIMSSKLVENRMLNIYMPIALLGLLFNLIGKLLIVKREQNNFKYIGKDIDKFGLFCIQDDYDAEKITKGLVKDYPVTTYKKKTKFANDFIKYTYSYDIADKFSKFAVPIVCIISLIVSLISAIVYNKSFDMLFPIGFVSILSMLLSFCSCFSIPVCINSMLYNTSKKYAKHGGVALGYQAVDDFYDTNSIIINSKDIFPEDSINISALKLFSNAKIDETLIYAISLSNKVDSILAPTLLKMLDGNLDMLCEVENYSYEDGLGLCGWIDNKRVLMGNRELMEAHNIENLPTKSNELELVGSNKDCVYISVSGNLALMLILDIVPNKQVKRNLKHLQDNNISIAVTSCDFLVSVNKISYLFGIDEDIIKIIPYELFQETKEYFSDKPKCSTSIVTNGNIGIITNLILSTKKIHSKGIISNMLNAVSCILGIIIGISFITMGGFRELTSTMILIYNLICTGIIMLICNNKNS